MKGGFVGLDGVPSIFVKGGDDLVGVDEVIDGSTEVAVIDTSSHGEAGVQRVDHVELPRHQDNCRDKGEGVALAYPACSWERGAECGAEFDGAYGVGVKVVPNMGEGGWEADVYEHVSGEGGLKRVEEFFVVVGGHGSAKFA